MLSIQSASSYQLDLILQSNYRHVQECLVTLFVIRHVGRLLRAIVCCGSARLYRTVALQTRDSVAAVPRDPAARRLHVVAYPEFPLPPSAARIQLQSQPRRLDEHVPDVASYLLLDMPVELRKRKAPAAPPQAPPTKKKAEKAKAAAAQPAKAASAKAPKDAPNGAKASTKVAVGDILDLSSFDGEIETHDGDKTTLKKLVDDSDNGVVLFTYPKASTPGCKYASRSITPNWDR